MAIPRFQLGQILATPGALEALEDAGQTINDFLDRHAQCDWGELCQEDWDENEYSLQEGFRLLSAYTTLKGEKLYLITEADRSSSTLLRPEEY
jgi:hypothetical protein